MADKTIFFRQESDTTQASGAPLTANAQKRLGPDFSERQTRLFDAFCIGTLAIGAVAYISAMLAGRGFVHPWDATSFLVAVIWFGVITFGRRITLDVRAAGVALLAYTLGVVTLYRYGPLGSARTFFVTFSVVVCLFMSLRIAMISLALNIMAIASATWLFYKGYVIWPEIANYTPLSWILDHIIFMTLCSAITVLLAMVKRGLVQSLMLAETAANEAELANLRLAAEIEERTKAEADLARRLEIESTLAAISSRFADDAAFDTALDSALSDMGRLSQAARCYTFLFDVDAQTMSNTHEWCAPSVSPQMHNLQRVPLSSVPWWMEQVAAGTIMDIPSVSDMPPEARSEKAILDAQGICSLLVVPLWIEDRVGGFIGLDDVSSIREWTTSDKSILRLFGQIVANAFERHRTYEALKESEQRYRNVLESAPEGIAILSTDRTVQYANRQLLGMLGLSAKEVIGHSADLWIESDSLNMTTETHLWNDTSGTRRVGKFLLHRNDGQRIAAETSETQITYAGQPAYLEFVRDVQDRQMLEEHLRQAHKMEAVGQLAGGVAHEFNNLLTVINGYAEILLGRARPSEADHEDLRTILSAGRRAAGLTRQLLIFSRREKLDMQPVNLNEAVQAMLGFFEPLTGPNIQLALSLDTDLNLIYTDLRQAEQAILNLVLNACDAMPKGGILTISTANTVLEESLVSENGRLPAGEYVHFTVADTGMGMTPEIQARVFEPFFTTKQTDKGTGLGLAVVYGIVRDSQGGIVVKSHPGRGTSMQIYFPRFEGAAIPSVNATRDLTTCTEKRVVLVVEDRQDVRTVVTHMASELGFEVVQAESGSQALETFREQDGKIDLLFTNVVMPGLDGPQLVQELSDRGYAGPVLYMTGYAEPDLDLLTAPDGSGMVQIINKPFSSEQLAERLCDMLAQS